MAGSVYQCENVGGWAKTRQPFSAFSGSKFNKFGACSVDWQESFRLFISCSVQSIAEKGSVKVQSRSQKRFLPQQPVGVNAWRSSDQIGF